MFDSRLHDHWDPPQTRSSRMLVEAMVAAGREENRAAARRLAAVGELFEMRRAQRGEAADWAVDTWAAVGAEVAAALRVSLGRAGSFISYGLAMRDLPRVAAVFAAGEIDMSMFSTVVYRTELVTDDAARARVDQTLAGAIAGWPSMSRGKLTREIDRIVNAVDPDAVRRASEQTRDRDVTIWHNADGTADLSGRLLGADAHALDVRLDALAAGVCADDPRTKAQRRADALGALAAGADRLSCRCEGGHCPALAGPRPSAGVVIHVVAEQSSIEGRTDKPALLLGANTLISAGALRELAGRTRLRPVSAPGEAEPRYRPSAALADFVRARDVTCRAPGCDRPATVCDLDHTVPYAEGGCTHASNLKCLCRFHHLLKTFWGWADRQLPDGTVIWTVPDGQTYTTTPGSASLFPALSVPTPPPPRRRVARGDTARRSRTAKMPPRRTARATNLARRITTERNRNRAQRERSGITVSDDPPF